MEDLWNDKLPDRPFKNVNVPSLRSWVYYGLSWGIGGGVFVGRRRGGGYAC